MSKSSNTGGLLDLREHDAIVAECLPHTGAAYVEPVELWAVQSHIPGLGFRLLLLYAAGCAEAEAIACDKASERIPSSHARMGVTIYNSWRVSHGRADEMILAEAAKVAADLMWSKKPQPSELIDLRTDEERRRYA